MRSLPLQPNLQQLRKQAKELLKVHRRGESSACGTLRWLFRFGDSPDETILGAEITLAEAQHALAMDWLQGLEDPL